MLKHPYSSEQQLVIFYVGVVALAVQQSTTMKSFVRTFFLVLSLSGAIAAASPINITVDASGDLLNTIGIANSTQYGQANNNPDSNLTFLSQLVTNWNGVYSPDLPAVVGPVAANFGSLGDVSSYTTLSGYDYVVFHFGAGRAGGQQVSAGGWWQALYLGGVGGDSLSLPQVGGKNVGGFSSARYFNGASVPDGSMTVILLGLGLAGIAFVSRKN